MFTRDFQNYMIKLTFHHATMKVSPRMYLWGVELCDTIDTTQYHDTKWYRYASSFGIVGIDYAI